VMRAPITTIALVATVYVNAVQSVPMLAARPMIWGSATAAYQVEGHRNATGRQPSVWDCFDTQMKGSNGVPCMSLKAIKPNNESNVHDFENAAVADNDYANYPETIAELQKFGFGAYRMSISWPRVLSYEVDVNGKPVGKQNKEGIAHYRKVLTALKAAKIEVALTMWHWDTPMVLENWAYTACKTGGASTGSFWLCKQSATYFEEYAALLLREFGPLVQNWITLNEPLTVIENGYAGSAPHAPGRCSDRELCFDGNDAVEPFVAIHNMLRAHAMGFNAWKASSNTVHGSRCGITLNGDFGYPASTSPEDQDAADRFMEYEMAIFMDPIMYGRWPASVQKGANGALPTLDPVIPGTHTDIYFQNHYTTQYVWASPYNAAAKGYTKNGNFSTSGIHPKSKKPIGLPSSNGWLFDYPPGLAKNQEWLHARYPSMSIMVTENGWGNASTSEAEDVNDLVRCNYYRSYIGNMSKTAHDSNITVEGFFAWSIMDNYEWADGFSTRFGLTYVDYTTQVRIPKLSMRWFASITKLAALPSQGQDAFPTCESLLE